MSSSKSDSYFSITSWMVSESLQNVESTFMWGSGLMYVLWPLISSSSSVLYTWADRICQPMSDLNKHKWQAASKLTDPINIGDVEVRSHREACDIARERLRKNKHVAQIQLGHLPFPQTWALLLLKMLMTTILIMHQQMREAVFPRSPKQRVSLIQVR